MSMFKIFDTAGSGMAAQSLRLNTVASNLANAESVSSTQQGAYRAKEPLFAAVKQRVEGAMADANGYVYGSNVNPVDELVNMISASRSYQNNVEVMNTTKQLMLKTLTLGQ